MAEKFLSSKFCCLDGFFYYYYYYLLGLISQPCLPFCYVAFIIIDIPVNCVYTNKEANAIFCGFILSSCLTI